MAALAKIGMSPDVAIALDVCRHIFDYTPISATNPIKHRLIENINHIDIHLLRVAKLPAFSQSIDGLMADETPIFYTSFI